MSRLTKAVSDFIGRLRFERVQCSHLGTLKEELSSKELAKNRVYFISNFNEKMKLFRRPPASLLSLQFRWSHEQVRLRFPANVDVFTSSNTIWKGAENESPNLFASLEWTKWPGTLFVSYPNGQVVSFERIQSRKPLLTPASFAAGFLVLSLLTHTLAGGFITWSGKLAFQKAQQQAANSIDISKLKLRISNSQNQSPKPRTSKEPRNLENRRLERMKKLVKAWNVGTPIESADEVLPASKFEELFREEFESSNKDKPSNTDDWKEAWSELQTDDDEKALNLSPPEVAGILQPAVPKLQRCFDDALIKDRRLSGNPKLWININIEGRVESVRIENLQAKKESIDFLESCFESSYRGIKTPKKPNQAFSVTRTLVLQQRKLDI